MHVLTPPSASPALLTETPIYADKAARQAGRQIRPDPRLADFIAAYRAEGHRLCARAAQIESRTKLAVGTTYFLALGGTIYSIVSHNLPGLVCGFLTMGAAVAASIKMPDALSKNDAQTARSLGKTANDMETAQLDWEITKREIAKSVRSNCARSRRMRSVREEPSQGNMSCLFPTRGAFDRALNASHSAPTPTA